MADETEKKAGLLETHPEITERHARILALGELARVARKQGRPLDDAVRAEAVEVLGWADGVIAEAVGDVAAFLQRVERDRAAFAIGLRLNPKGSALRESVRRERS